MPILLQGHPDRDDQRKPTQSAAGTCAPCAQRIMCMMQK